MLRAGLKGFIVGVAVFAALAVLRLAYVLPAALFVGLLIAVLASWKEQRRSTVGAWPAVAAGSAYLSTVLVLIGLMASRQVFMLRGVGTAAESAQRADVAAGRETTAPQFLIPIGVGAALRDGRLCVAMGRPLSPGTALTLVQVVRPQTAIVATVVEATVTCDRLAEALIAAPYYFVDTPDETGAPSMSPWVVFLGATGTRRVGVDAIAIELPPHGTNVQVRSCSSREGLHLTAWAGTPLSSGRLWHQYYYLGYDVEPTCDDREVGQ